MSPANSLASNQLFLHKKSDPIYLCIFNKYHQHFCYIVYLILFANHYLLFSLTTKYMAVHQCLWHCLFVVECPADVEKPKCQNQGFVDFRANCEKCRCPEGFGGVDCSEVQESSPGKLISLYIHGFIPRENDLYPKCLSSWNPPIYCVFKVCVQELYTCCFQTTETCHSV